MCLTGFRIFSFGEPGALKNNGRCDSTPGGGVGCVGGETLPTNLTFAYFSDGLVQPPTSRSCLTIKVPLMYHGIPVPWILWGMVDLAKHLAII